MAGILLVSNDANGVVIPLGRTWRIVEAPNLSLGVEGGASKLQFREGVNVNSVGFDGEGVPIGLVGDTDAEGVSRDLIGR